MRITGVKHYLLMLSIFNLFMYDKNIREEFILLYLHIDTTR